MAVILTQIERDIMNCISTDGPVRCSIFDPDNQPSVQRDLESGWDPIIWWIYNGMSFDPGSGIGKIDFSERVVCCMKHEEELIARGGWDGTGERQSTK